MNSATQLMKAFGLQKPEYSERIRAAFESLKEMAEACTLPAGPPEEDEVIKGILNNHLLAHTGYNRIGADDLPGLQDALDHYINMCIVEDHLPEWVRGRAAVSYDLSTGRASVFYPLTDEMLRARRTLRRQDTVSMISREALRRTNRTRFA